ARMQTLVVERRTAVLLVTQRNRLAPRFRRRNSDRISMIGNDKAATLGESRSWPGQHRRKTGQSWVLIRQKRNDWISILWRNKVRLHSSLWRSNIVDRITVFHNGQ